jgi:hypothetical protein
MSLITRLAYGASQLPPVAWYLGHGLALRRLSKAATNRVRARSVPHVVTAIASLSLLLGAIQPALPWGDEGHKTIALIAQQCLTRSAKGQITAMLAADTDPLTPHDMASEAAWADRYRDMGHRTKHYEQTQNWHYTDIEIDHPDLTAACFGHNSLPASTLASNGPPQACAVDKIKQFQAELTVPNLDTEERLYALKFLLHLVGDLHQPLHSSDNHDKGGNEIKVVVDGFAHNARDELHGFWDTQFVERIRRRPAAIAKLLLAEITPAKASKWAAGSLEDWAMESFNLAKADVYGSPPLSKGETQHLDSNYVDRAEADVRLQLSRAGIRLAHVLNASLGSEPDDWNACLSEGQ